MNVRVADKEHCNGMKILGIGDDFWGLERGGKERGILSGIVQLKKKQNNRLNRDF